MAGEASKGARRPDGSSPGAGSADARALALNRSIAARLDEVAAMLHEQRANPFRVRAYRRGADELRRLPVPVTRILEDEGLSGLERLPAIGLTLARTIRDIVRLGYFPMLERMRGDLDPMHLLATVPGIGRRLAGRLQDELGIETLEDLEAAAFDGRLEHLAGFGPKRLAGIRAVLAERLGRVRLPRTTASPPVAELLAIDREYREQAAEDSLPRIAPRRFNPEGRRWLPVLHTSRGSRHYTALFSNTERAHRFGKTDDWVVIYGDHERAGGQWTVVTAMEGPLKGRRVVRGRESECAAYYRGARL